MSRLFNDAYIYASEKHKNQTRKDGTPYINHPISVAQLVEKYFKDNPKLDKYIITAYLHDTLEDTDATYEEISNKFGEEIANYVQSLTNNNTLKTKMGKTNYLCYKMVNMNEDVLNIKLCDRLANIYDLIHADNSFQEKYIIETLTILHYLINNKTITPIQNQIIKDINNKINEYQKEKIKVLIKEIEK